MIHLNSCDEVLEFLIKGFQNPFSDEIVEFQGEIVSTGGNVAPVSPATEVCLRYRLPGVAFLVGPENNFGEFRVSVAYNGSQLDELFSIDLPAYCRREFIATARGLV